MKIKRLPGWGLVLMNALPLAGIFVLTPIITSTIHESGHAVVCLIDGGTVTQFHPFGARPQTGCFPLTLTPVRCAAGSLASVVGWLLFTYVVSKRAVHMATGLGWNCIAFLWISWSFWIFAELYVDALHAYTDVSLQTDAGYFVHVSGINPIVVSAVVVLVIPLLSVPLVRVGGQLWQKGPVSDQHGARAAQCRRASPAGSLRSVTAALHGSAAARGTRRSAPQ